MEREELVAGLGQLIVLYEPADTGNEVDPVFVWRFIAEDAARINAGQGLRIVAVTTMPLRHAGVAFGSQGSGYETKAAVAVVYGTP